MKCYSIYITYEAKNDIDDVYDYIAVDLMSPITAYNYRNGILQTIKGLKATADIYAPIQNEYIQSLYGIETRKVRYKKIVIIYTIINDKIFIRRVIAGSLIK